MKEKLGLYIHIPFCQKKCHYCDFLTFIGHDEMIEKYVKYLNKEIEMYRDNDYILDTIYIGGGTPSYLEDELMTSILDKVKKIFTIDDKCEITIEMNPESVTEKKIQSYLKSGINRFSMGVQSFDDEVLKIMGRIHNRKTVIEKLDIMKKKGCQNISIDMMMANPKQDIEILKKDLEIASSLDINHISYYSLILKEHTHFEMWFNEGKINLYDPKEERDMYHLVTNTLKEKGFNQYEISSFSKPGFESVHNQKYWNLKNYLGVGMGASANINLVRTTNTRSFDEYFESIDNGEFPIVEREELNTEMREKEYLMLNLRMLKGFEISDINSKFNIDFMKKYKDIVEKHSKNGILEISENSVKFTEYGIDNGNMLFRDLYSLNDFE
ncbi:radical SAM family heme chaperone HemW [Helcococcus sueciensis]|uniref:radical SAM family heme chaperone HemW n=1 Tax=Helcococcus sueciensis TaxID=241555 RepID=UPI0004839E5E|nr:radical SAM family heme chaperone HemW [Helcococcus sueciensis]